MLKSYIEDCDLGELAEFALKSWDTDESRRLCQSDVDIYLEAERGYEWLYAQNSSGQLIDGEGISTGESYESAVIEGEFFPAAPFYTRYDAFPRPGDIVHALGRGIIDCGHYPFKAEVHPPGVMGVIRSGEYQGRPSTHAFVNAKWWFDGTMVEPIRVYGPPRPNAGADLKMVRTLGGQVDVPSTRFEIIHGTSDGYNQIHGHFVEVELGADGGGGRGQGGGGGGRCVQGG